jgi:predicted permease
MLIDKIIPLFMIFGIILVLKQKHFFHKQDGQVIGKMLANLVIPSTILNAFSTVTFDKQLFLLPVLGAIVVLCMLGIGFLLSTILDLPRTTRGAFIISFPTLEGGTVGYVLMLAVFGKNGLVPIALFDLGNAFAFFGVIFFVAYSLGKGREKLNLASGLLQLCKSPIIWSFIAGILLNVLHIHMDAFSALVDTISQATLLLIMVMLALEFEPSFATLRLPLLTIMLKTAIGFSIGVAATFLLHIRGVEQIAIIIGASLPASLLTLVFSSENSLDSQFVANLLSMALPCAFLFDIALIYFLGIG